MPRHPQPSLFRDVHRRVRALEQLRRGGRVVGIGGNPNTHPNGDADAVDDDGLGDAFTQFCRECDR